MNAEQEVELVCQPHLYSSLETKKWNEKSTGINLQLICKINRPKKKLIQFFTRHENSTLYVALRDFKTGSRSCSRKRGKKII